MHDLDPKPDSEPTPLAPLGFSLSFVAGKGILALENVTAGPVIVRRLELEIPNIAFPFDVSGGAVGFKHHRCDLRRLVLGLRAQTIREMVESADLDAVGIHDFKFSVQDGFAQLFGRLEVGGAHAYFTQKLACIPSSPRDLAIVFYDTRVYGWLPVPAPFVADFLKRALEGEMLRSTSTEVWELQPVEQFVRQFLPRHGWKVPSTHRAPLVDTTMARGRVFVVAGTPSLANDKKQQESATPQEALKALEGVSILSVAENTLARGQVTQSFHLYKDAYAEGRVPDFSAKRLLQLGATDPQWFAETEHLAQTLIDDENLVVDAHLAQASIAIHQEQFEKAHEHLEALRSFIGKQDSRADRTAWDLICAEVAAHVSPEAALEAYERAAKSARDSRTAHESLFMLRKAAGDADGAMEAARRWLRLTKAPAQKVDVHLKIGRLCLFERDDLRGARYHFERALRLEPNHPHALEGLAEALLVQGDVTKAVALYRQLTEQVEDADDRYRYNVRLGDLWADNLGDVDAAIQRYQFAVESRPQEVAARLRLAQLLAQQDQLRSAQTHYLDLIALAEQQTPDDHETLTQAYEELADVYERAGAPISDQIDALVSACRLAPDNAVIRERCARALSKAERWEEANHHLQQALDLTSGEKAQIRIRLTAADIYAQGLFDFHGARAHLEEVLSHDPANEQALRQLRPRPLASR